MIQLVKAPVKATRGLTRITNRNNAESNAQQLELQVKKGMKPYNARTKTNINIDSIANVPSLTTTSDGEDESECKSDFARNNNGNVVSKSYQSTSPTPLMNDILEVENENDENIDGDGLYSYMRGKKSYFRKNTNVLSEGYNDQK